MICFLARNKPSRVVPNQRLSSPSLYVDKISALSSGGGTAAFLSSNSFCIEGKSTSHSEPSASFATSPSREPVIKHKGYFGKPSRSSKTAVTRPFSARANAPVGSDQPDAPVRFLRYVELNLRRAVEIRRLRY